MNATPPDAENYQSLITAALASIEGEAPAEEIASAKVWEIPRDFLDEDDGKKDLRTIIAGMTVPQRVKLALVGNATARTLLIRDANALIQTSVLKNPKLTPKEIEEFAKNPNLSDRVLRQIGANDQWAAAPLVKQYLVWNPKTPIDITLRLMRALPISEMRKLARSKNVPSAISTVARKIVESKSA